MWSHVERDADVWSPEARQAINNRDHSCLPKDAELSGQTVHVNISKEETEISRSPTNSSEVEGAEPREDQVEQGRSVAWDFLIKSINFPLFLFSINEEQ